MTVPYLRVRYDPTDGATLPGVSAATATRPLGANVGGMIVGTYIWVLVPTLFIVFQTLREKVKPLGSIPITQWAGVRARLEECRKNEEKRRGNT